MIFMTCVLGTLNLVIDLSMLISLHNTPHDISTAWSTCHPVLHDLLIIYESALKTALFMRRSVCTIYLNAVPYFRFFLTSVIKRTCET